MLPMELTQPVSAPLQSSLHLLPDLLSAPPLVHLAMYFPPVMGSGMDLPCSVGMTRWVRSTLYAGSVRLPMTAKFEAAVLTARRAPQHIRLSRPDDAFECLRILAMPSSLGPLRLMLADTPSPHGSGATLASVGTLSEGFERSVASPLQPRRLRAMGCTV
jgi:hypothetical protein